MLSIFALSIAPKMLLHVLFANHKDSIIQALSDQTHSQKINKTIIHCQCDDLVVECPFISENNEISVAISFSFAIQPTEKTNNFTSSSPLSYGLRGPPASV